MNDRGVFLKTVFSAYERFDSVQARIDTDTGSILCQKIVTSGRQHLILNHGSRVTKLSGDWMSEFVNGVTTCDRAEERQGEASVP
jgi:hypothetical protein